MADEGYVVCDEEENERAYILKFADNSKWVTVTSEEYDQGNQLSRNDAGRLAKMLGTYCMNTIVIDSDCAAVYLYGKEENFRSTATSKC